MKKATVLILALCLVLALLAGCGNGAAGSAPASQSASQQPEAATAAPAADASTPAAPDAEPADPAELTLPLTEDEVTFSFWYFGRATVEATMEKGMHSNNVFQTLIETTGVDFDFVCASEPTAFSILVAGGEYPDFMVGAVDRYSSGADNAIADEVLMDLTELLEKNAPNYWNYIKSDDKTFRAATTNEGRIAAVYAFADQTIAGDGPMVRQEWLDEIGMEAPSTYDGYYEMLTAFKTELNAESAMILPGAGAPRDGYLAGGYGIQAYTTSIPSLVAPFYQQDGKVKFGLAESGLKDYLTMLNKWYSEGLIFKDYYSYVAFNPENDVIGAGQSGLWWADLALVDTYSNMFGYTVAAIPDATIKDGDVNHLGFSSETIRSAQNISISAQCKDPELAVRFLDYLFTDEGSFLCNYGIEGVTFERDGDSILFTEMMTNNPDGLSLNKMLYKCCIDTQVPFFVTATREWGSYSDAALASQDIWGSNRDGEWLLPLTMSKTAEESDRFSVVFSDIMTYSTECINKMIVGEMSMDEFDAFVEQQYTLGLQECIDIYQAAYDRYLAR